MYFLKIVVVIGNPYKVFGISTTYAIALIGSTLWIDRLNYFITQMPQELIGSTIFQPKHRVGISTVDIFSPHTATIYVAILDKVLPKQSLKIVARKFDAKTHNCELALEF